MLELGQYHPDRTSSDRLRDRFEKSGRPSDSSTGETILDTGGSIPDDGPW
jgi:hypothetical protein